MVLCASVYTGIETKNNNKKNKNELCLIFHTSAMQILSYYRQTLYSYPVVVKDVDSQSNIEVFKMYGAGPAPSLYTKYYRAW